MATLEQRVLTFVQRWQITAFMLASLLMQALLLLTGKARRWDPAWRHVAWVAYNASSYVGSAALGALAQQAAAAVLAGSAGGPRAAAIYAIWAPLLLLHLGGPDNVSAFDPADAELWPREGLTMALRLLTAAYVVATCARGGAPVLVSAILLLLVGAFKYVEHIQALRLASREAIVASTLPIYYYMLWEPTIQPQYHSDDPHRPRFYYIISGDKKWYEAYLKENDFVKARHSSPLVTLDDILTCPVLAQFTRPPLQEVKQPSSGLQNPPLGLLCLGFALHKMYKRRFSHLFMYEWRNVKIRELFLARASNVGDLVWDEQEILRLLEVELSFLYDALYTNAAGTAYSKQGVFFRVASAVLLTVTGVYIFNSIHFSKSAEQVSNARVITFLLFSAALGVEFYQLLRLMFSDWTRVWLASSCVKLHRAAESSSNSSSSWCVKAAGQASIAALQSAAVVWLWVSGRTPRLTRLWKPIEVGQYTMLQSDVERELRLAAMASHNNQTRAISTGSCGCVLIHGCQREMVLRGARAQETKTYVIGKVVERCREIWGSSPGAILQPLSSPFWFAQKYVQKGRSYDAVLKALVGWHPGDTVYYMDLEHLVVTWHLATCLCEQLLIAELHGIINPNNVGAAGASSSSSSPLRVPPNLLGLVSMASRLSRYATYLLVQKTQLLPSHPEISRQLARNTELKLRQMLTTMPPIKEPFILKEQYDSSILKKVLVIVEEEENKVEDNELTNAIKATKVLQYELDLVDRWQFIGDIWVDLIMHMAYDNMSIEHLQQLTQGEELLTQLWVLLGHVGYGKQ